MELKCQSVSTASKLLYNYKILLKILNSSQFFNELSFQRKNILHKSPEQWSISHKVTKLIFMCTCGGRGGGA